MRAGFGPMYNMCFDPQLQAPLSSWPATLEFIYKTVVLTGAPHKV
jgi:hypothetical protein